MFYFVVFTVCHYNSLYKQQVSLTDIFIHPKIKQNDKQGHLLQLICMTYINNWPKIYARSYEHSQGDRRTGSGGWEDIPGHRQIYWSIPLQLENTKIKYTTRHLQWPESGAKLCIPDTRLPPPPSLFEAVVFSFFKYKHHLL